MQISQNRPTVKTLYAFLFTQNTLTSVHKSLFSPKTIAWIQGCVQLERSEEGCINFLSLTLN